MIIIDISWIQTFLLLTSLDNWGHSMDYVHLVRILLHCYHVPKLICYLYFLFSHAYRLSSPVSRPVVGPGARKPSAGEGE